MWEIIKNIYYIMYPLIKNNMHNCREILTHRVIDREQIWEPGTNLTQQQHDW